MSESRIELINWLNDLLQLGIVKVEQVGQGAIPCQILDSIWSDVPLHRVKFSAAHEYEYINNFKIFQTALSAHGISREIPVERLVKLRMQDNLEFLQWLKKLWDSKFQGPYDAVNRRQQLGIRASPKPLASSGQEGPMRPGKNTSTATTSYSPIKHNQLATSQRNSLSSPSRPSLHSSSSSGAAVARGEHNAISQLSQENAELRRKITELTVCIDRIEKERDFYFKRLRQVEILCQNSEKTDYVDKVLEILYAETASNEESNGQ